MGLSNAPAVFQSAMNQIFGPLLNRCVCVYLDDILIFSKTEKEHLRHLEQVLALLRKHDLKAKMAKCEFFKPELKFLGHIVSVDGMRPDPAKVATVRDWPTPVSVYEVRSFLGLANYFRKYIRGYSTVAAPLTDLLKGIHKQDKQGKLLRFNRLPPAQVTRLKAEFATRWSPACATAFAALKDALTEAPVLVPPNLDAPFELIADACECPPAVGAVLVQHDRPVAYYSRKLKDAEVHYSASDIEMLAVICALGEWRCYVEGAHFTIVTDHRPNTYLDQATNAHTLKRRARWLDISCGYDYEWEYRPGRSNVADPISRAPQHFDSVCSRLSFLRLPRADHPAGPCGAPSCTRARTAAGAASPCQLLGVISRDCCVSSALLCRDADLNAGSSGDAAGTAAQGGGSDTPAMQFADPMVQQWLTPGPSVLPSFECDLPYPSPLASVATEGREEDVHTFFLNNFFDRVVAGYASDTSVSPSQRAALNLRTDAKGLSWTLDECLLVPDFDNLRKECFESVHVHPYSGHYGNKRTLAKAKTIYFWPNMARDIEHWCATCDSCQRVKAQRQKPQGKLQPLEIPGRRWSSVSMDLITDLPRTNNGNDSIWVVVDRLSKMVHLVALTKTCPAESIAAVYEKEVFRLHGIPETIVSDRDVRFTSRFWRALNERFKTRLAMSTKYHPQTDGQTENANGVLEDTLRHFVGPFQSDWEDSCQ